MTCIWTSLQNKRLDPSFDEMGRGCQSDRSGANNDYGVSHHKTFVRYIDDLRYEAVRNYTSGVK